MKIKRPVQVKVILTETSKNDLSLEYQERLSQLNLELEQLRFQSKKMIHDASKKSPDLQRLTLEKLRQEEKRKNEQIENLQFQIEQIDLLPIGTEILHSTIESEVEIKVGDVWEDLMKSSEIIIRDGIVHEIREGREEKDDEVL
ncbi:YlqD family protein [Caldalkalibacillus mannanilyticus]|uniref:YlqD family protein n=1 Tax=Caldalkalibacillus mannanilyticus TaxID=1418 RepID=UPI000685C54E|nr:YlqD family protein [Caldalkalibacillus mannanilyticus]